MGQGQAKFTEPTKIWGEDESHIHVKQGKGSVCHAVMGARVEASPNEIFTLFQRPDYDNMFRIFKLVREHRVVTDDGQGQQEFEVVFDAQWRFWKVRGTCVIPLRMKLNKSLGEIKFDQIKPGFLKVYNGVWRILQLSDEGTIIDPETTPWYKPPLLPSQGANGNGTLIDGGPSGKSLVMLELNVCPALVPPPPLNRALKGNTANQVESLFEDLKKELKGINDVPVLRGRKLMEESSSEASSSDKIKVDVSGQLAVAKSKKINGLDFDFRFDD